MTNDQLIEFTKANLDNLKYEDGEWRYAKNIEGLCIRILKTKKSYYAHWSIPVIGKDGYCKRVGKRKKLGGYHIPLAEIKILLRKNIDDFKKASQSEADGVTVGGLVKSFLRNGTSGKRIRTRGKRLNYKPKTERGYRQVLTRYVLLQGKKQEELQ